MLIHAVDNHANVEKTPNHKKNKRRSDGPERNRFYRAELCPETKNVRRFGQEAMSNRISTGFSRRKNKTTYSRQLLRERDGLGSKERAAKAENQYPTGIDK